MLHLHLSDMARFAWESKVFPELNVGYPGDTRYWKQDEIRELIQYAKLRGVRVVPEIDMSTPAQALYPLSKTQGLQFCNDSFHVMLFDDAARNVPDVPRGAGVVFSNVIVTNYSKLSVMRTGI